MDEDVEWVTVVIDSNLGINTGRREVMVYKYSEGNTSGALVFLAKSLRSSAGRSVAVISIEGRKDRDGKWVVFTTDAGDEIWVNGFQWGYRGQGPQGLAVAARQLGFTQLTLDAIAAYKENEPWKVTQSALESKARRATAAALVQNLHKQIKDEQEANDMYSRMSVDAHSLGYEDVALQLRRVANDESGHKATLQHLLTRGISENYTPAPHERTKGR